jgi:uncharacterized protein YrrD
MNIQLHKKIECTNGVCGKTAWVIINPVTQQVTHLVVRDKSLSRKEHLMPIEQVSSITYDSVQVKCSKEDIKKSEPFEKKQFIPASTFNSSSVPHLMHPYIMSRNLLVPQKAERIPPDALMIRRGAHVEAADGHAGKVEEFLVEPAVGKITHLLVSAGHFYDKRRIFVPVAHIDHVSAGTVYLKSCRKEIAALPSIPVNRCYMWHNAPPVEPDTADSRQKFGRESALIKTLIGFLTSRSGLTRQYARTSLVAIGKPAVPALLALLKNKKSRGRWEVLKALGEIRDPSAISELITRLNDESFEIRWLAAEALVALGSQVIVPLLQALIRQSDSVYVRESAHHILRSLVDDKTKKFIRPVLTALEDMDYSMMVPMAARKALRSLE